MTTSSAALIAALLGIALNNYSAEATEPLTEAAPATQSATGAQGARPQLLPTSTPANGEAVRPVKRQMAPLRPGDRFAGLDGGWQSVVV